MGQQQNVDMSVEEDQVKHVEVEEPALEEEPAEQKSKKPRSKKYQAVRAKLDKTRKYTVENAVEMVKDLSYSNFEGTISAAVVVKETGRVGSVTLPHQTGNDRNIVIVDDEVLQQIEDGQVDDIDVLLADPQYMPKLAKHGRILGPKGLMPNPKNGTLTPNPEEKKKELEAGKLLLKTQEKQPVFHLAVGTESMETDKIVENIKTLIEELGQKLVKLSLSATMSPGVRVDIDSVRQTKSDN